MQNENLGLSKTHNKTSVGLPAGLMKTFSTGCPGYESLKNVPFSPQIEQNFNPKLAAWSINACTYAYQDLCHKNEITYPPEVENGNLLYWYADSGFFSKELTSCGYIAKIKDIPGDPTNRIALIFRGTQKNKEWGLDANVKQTEVLMEPSGEIVKIHEGFWEIFTSPAGKNIPSLQEQIHTYLPNYLSNNRPNELHIGGHSMGSAIATLSALDAILRNPGLKVNSYITGCPRVGNPAFANTVNDLAKNGNFNFSIWRIANTEDVVTTLPEPVFKELVYSHLLISDIEDPNVIDLISFTKNLGKIWDNHHLFNYYYAMKNLISEEDYGR